MQRRQRAVDEALAAVDADIEPPDADALELLRDHGLGRLPGRIFAAGQAIADGDSTGVQQLADVSGQVTALARWIDDVRPLRPLREVTTQTQTAVRSLVHLHESVVRALGAASITQAQEAKRKIQPALDTAEHATARAAQVLDQLMEILSGDDPMATWIAAATEGNPIAASARGQAMFQSMTGRPCGPAAGTLAVVLDLQSTTVGDRDRFWQLVGQHLDVLDAATAGLDQVFADPAFPQHVHEVTDDLWAAARKAAVAPEPETLRQAASDLLEAGHLISERVLKFHLGIATAATTKNTFTATQGSDVSELVNMAIAMGWPVGSALPGADVRNAFAHRDYQVHDDEVLLSPSHRNKHGSTQLSMSLGEVLDAVLQSLEVGQAMELALTVALEDHDAIGLVTGPAKYLAQVTLAAIGCTDVEIAISSGHAQLTATADRELRLNALTFLAQPFVGVADQLTARLQRTDVDMIATVTVRLDDFDTWVHLEDGVDKEIAFLDLLRSTHRDARPLADDRHLHKLAARRVLDAVVDRSRPYPVVATELKAWRSLARRHGLDDLQRLIGRAQMWRLSIEAGNGADPNDMNELIAAAAETVEVFETMLV